MKSRSAIALGPVTLGLSALLVAGSIGAVTTSIADASSRAQSRAERTALHEIAHTLGVGQRKAFDDRCASGNWPTALPLLRSWDGASAKISCGGSHFWPYGLNYETEWSSQAGDRHCLIVKAMLDDGMAAY